MVGSELDEFTIYEILNPRCNTAAITEDREMKLMMSDVGLVARAMRRSAERGHDPYDTHASQAKEAKKLKQAKWRRDQPRFTHADYIAELQERREEQSRDIWEQNHAR